MKVTMWRLGGAPLAGRARSQPGLTDGWYERSHASARARWQGRARYGLGVESADRLEKPSISGGQGRRARRRAEVAIVTSYHEAQLQKLLDRLDDGFRRHKNGELDAFALDALIHHYSRTARELWKFCGDLSGAAATSTARALTRMRDEAEEVDWWERGRLQSG
jgi:hypothetical protein